MKVDSLGLHSYHTISLLRSLNTNLSFLSIANDHHVKCWEINTNCLRWMGIFEEKNNQRLIKYMEMKHCKTYYLCFQSIDLIFHTSKE